MSAQEENLVYKKTNVSTPAVDATDIILECMLYLIYFIIKWCGPYLSGCYCMCTFNNGPRILGKIELPEVYQCKPGYESVICICCGESSGTMYKQGNGQWAHDECMEAEEAQYWDEMFEQQQRHQDRLNALRNEYND